MRSTRAQIARYVRSSQAVSVGLLEVPNLRRMLTAGEGRDIEIRSIVLDGLVSG